jgi:F-type H+-transporting ATPase subunit b
MPSTVLADTAVLAQENNNFLVPNATFFVEVVLFFIVLGVLARWVLPPITRAITERQDILRRRLTEAQEATERFEAAEARYREALADARHEGSQIREQARQQGAAVIAEARQRAADEAQGILDEARRRIEADRERAFERLRTEVGTLATELAGRVVGEPLTGESWREEMIERFLADVERRAAAGTGSGSGGGAKPVRAD